MTYDAVRYANDPAYRAARQQAIKLGKRTRVPPGWRKFGGTQKLFDKFWKKQKGTCGICKKELDRERGDRSRSNKAHFDHCHVTLKARGILCFSCNQKLGWYEKYQQEIGEYL